MALALRGGTSNSAIDGGSVTLTHPVGIAEDDVVYVGHAIGSTADRALTLTTTGYTQLIEIYAASTRDTNLAVWRKVMPATPDSTVVCDGDGVAADAVAAVEHVWSGADTTTPEDATTTTATSTTSNVPNSPSITTATADAIVLSIGAGAQQDPSVTAPTGYGNKFHAPETDGNPIGVVIASKSVASPGAEDPAVWTDWTESSRSMCAATVAIRPAAVGGTTVNLIGQASTGATGSLSLSADASLTLAGQAGTGGIGSLSEISDYTDLPTGQSASGGIGSLSFSISPTIALTGVAAAGQAGIVLASVPIEQVTRLQQIGIGTAKYEPLGDAWIALTGQAASGELGSLSLSISADAALTGIQAAAQAGSLTPISDYTAQLTGQQAAGSFGELFIGLGPIITLTGQAATGGVGTLGYMLTYQLAGLAAAGQAGAISTIVCPHTTRAEATFAAAIPPAPATDYPYTRLSQMAIGVPVYRDVDIVRFADLAKPQFAPVELTMTGVGFDEFFKDVCQ